TQPERDEELVGDVDQRDRAAVGRLLAQDGDAGVQVVEHGRRQQGAIPPPALAVDRHREAVLRHPRPPCRVPPCGDRCRRRADEEDRSCGCGWQHGACNSAGMREWMACGPNAPGRSWHTGDTVYRYRQRAHSSHMGEVRPIPTLGGVVRDVRGAERALRVSWHREDELVVLSLWNGPRCTGTVR